jgi:hypothetical protein
LLPANPRGKTFENAKIKLMAGDVSKIQRAEVAGYMRSEELAVSAAMPPSVSEKAFEDYHLYTLARPATLRDRETKQVEFICASGVKSERIYVYDGLKIDWNSGAAIAWKTSATIRTSAPKWKRRFR